ncbi:MAG: TlyA family RNA methyltransferase [Nitrospira sp.]|nr:TlyA family RNA methyltransferase [Nitrospira sp.]MCP9475072.1 TlyA family RNA methyltransferase [Nitrospira sp.]
MTDRPAVSLGLFRYSPLMDVHARCHKQRLDQLLVNQGFAESRERAARMILAGEVRVNGVLVDKPAKTVSAQAVIEVLAQSDRFVSRGGEKLAAALDAGSIDPAGLVCLDVGCSTGGFTDCLLQRGARRIYAVDVGYGQFDWRLRQDPRVVLMERTNIRYLDKSAIPEPVGLTVIDVSFISLTKVLPPVLQFSVPGAIVIALVKPQFEVGKGEVGRGGIVRDEVQRRDVLRGIVNFAAGLGMAARTTLECPLKGKKGNQELFAIFECGSTSHGVS